MQQRDLKTNVRRGLAVLALLAKLTPTQIDDEAVAFLESLVGDDASLDAKAATFRQQQAKTTGS